MDFEIISGLSLQQWTEIVQGGSLDLDETTISLIDIKMDIDNKKDKISSQIKDANRKVYTDNEYSDPGWYRRASDAVNHCKKQSQKVQHMLGIIKRQQKKNNIGHAEEKFIQAARKLLDKETFWQIMNASREGV